jgi:pentatricopeptide repeat protein
MGAALDRRGFLVGALGAGGAVLLLGSCGGDDDDDTSADDTTGSDEGGGGGVAGRHDEALVEFKRGLEVAPNLGVLHSVAAFAHLFAGHTAQAREEMETAVRNDPELLGRKGQLAYVYARTGDRDKALKLLEQMKRDASVNSNQVAFALVHIALGDTDTALTLLEEAVRRRDGELLTAASPLDDPVYAPVRNHPRFLRVMEQMDLLRFSR